MSRPRSRRRFWPAAAFIVLLLLLAAFYLLEEDQPTQNRTSDSATPMRTTTALQVFFTTPSLVYPDAPRNRTPPRHEQRLLADIDAARSSVELATFEYNLDSVAQALVRAAKRGVAVRLVLDRENLEKPEMAAWAGTVQKAKIPITWEDSTAFMHSKFVVIDQRLLWTGSWNVTVNDTYRNNNNLLRSSIPELVQNYHVEFEQMFAGHFDSAGKTSSTPYPRIEADGISIENYFSPQDRAVERIAERLRGAKRRIRFLAFSFTSDAVAKPMLEHAKAGVKVQGVFETRNAEGESAEYARLKRAGLDVWLDGNCYTMHHKVIIIDERTVITGSYNFTNRAETVNDENFLIIDDPALARRYIEEFDRVYAQAHNPTRCAR